MYTIIKKQNGEIIKFVTQQYDCGTYIIVNDNPALQQGTLLEENEFHKKLRIQAIKNNDIIVEGNKVKYKGKYNINKFN